jgi:hypothetical protein
LISAIDICDIHPMPWIVVATVVALALLLFWLKRHADWADAQTPVGVWIRNRQGRETVIAFEGGPHEGLYRQIRKYGDATEREFGHWAVSEATLHLLIMATDVKHHPRFGQDTKYKLIYTRADTNGNARRILINGPDRKNLFFVRAPLGVVVDFDAPDVKRTEMAVETPPDPDSPSQSG